MTGKCHRRNIMKIRFTVLSGRRRGAEGAEHGFLINWPRPQTQKALKKRFSFRILSFPLRIHHTCIVAIVYMYIFRIVSIWISNFSLLTPHPFASRALKTVLWRYFFRRSISKIYTYLFFKISSPYRGVQAVAMHRALNNIMKNYTTRVAFKHIHVQIS